MEMLSAFDPDVLAADSRAFAALMAHLRQVDGARRTVLMVQVENEVGMIPSAARAWAGGRRGVRRSRCRAR